METAYRVGVELALGGNLGRVIAQMIEQFTKLDKSVGTVQQSVNQLASAMGALGRQARAGATAFDAMASSAAKAAAAAERAARAMSKATSPAGTFGAGAAGAAAGAAAGGARPMLALPAPGEAPRLAAPGSGRSVVLYEETPYGAPDRRIPISNPYGKSGNESARGRGHGIGAMHAAIGDWFGWEATKSVFDPAFEYARLNSVLGGMSKAWTPAMIAAADAAAEQVRQRVTGSSVLSNLDLLGKLTSLTQNPSEAISALPGFAKLGVALNGLRPGLGNADLNDLFAAAQSGEYRGVLNKINPKTGKTSLDLAGLNKFIQFAAAEAYTSHGTVSPLQLLQMIRNAGPIGRTVSYQDLAESISMQQSMGSTKFGTALQAWGRQAQAGRMSEGVYHLWQAFGLTSRDKATWQHLGLGQIMMLPGAMQPAMQQMAATDPIGFINKELVPRLEKFAAEKYPKEWNLPAGTPADVTSEKHLQLLIRLGSMASSRDPVARLVAEVLSTQMQQIRDRDAIAAQLGVNPSTWSPIPGAKKFDFYGNQVSNNPFVKVSALMAAVQSLFITIGTANTKPAVEALGDISKVIDGLSKFSGQHPEAVRLGLDAVATGLVALNAAVAGRGLLKLGEMAMSVGRGVVALDGVLGGLAGASSGVIGPLAAVAAGTIAVTKGMVALDAELRSFAPWMYPGPHAAPLPQNGGQLYRPGYIPHWMPHWLYPGQDLPSAPSSGQSHAPTAPAQTSSMPVHITGGHSTVDVANGRDLVNGVASGIASQTNRPDQGYSGPNINAEPWSSSLYNTLP